MHAFGWKKDGSVQDWLFAEGYRFDFFQAIRLLEQITANVDSSGFIKKSAGSHSVQNVSSEIGLEAIQLRSRVGFVFPPSEIHEVNRVSETPFRAEIIANILSLAGTQGPLPDVFAELLLERTKHHDTALADFLDIFHHRLLLLMYRVRQRHRLWLEWQHPEQGRQAKYIYAFAGLGHPELKNRMDVPDGVILTYAGLLWQKPRSAIGLEGILSDFFGVKATIRPMVGTWLAIEKDDLTRVGKKGVNHQLSRSAVVGTKVWDTQRCFDVCFDPMSMQQFTAFLPGRKKYAALHALIKFYTNDHFEIRIQLALRAQEVPKTRLGRSQLGWTTLIQKQSAQTKRRITLCDRSSRFSRNAAFDSDSRD